MNDTLKFHVLRNCRRYIPIILLSAFSIALLLIRVKMTQSVFYMFLIWNLFLAGLPLVMSIIATNFKSIRNNRYLLYPTLLAWLMLLPNAPYLITDFLHFKRETTVPFWLDILLLGSFSISGFLLGLASMKNIYTLLTQIWGKTSAVLSMGCVCLLSGLGIYIGRVLRYNSWDILRHPLNLVQEITGSITNVETCYTAWGITLGFGFLQFLLFDLYTTSKN
ncbi:DUF1361 domain-containing protein [Flavobacterium sp. RHBU_3]|uniref:DUF1361 domain-containing protein n=1 Tax=Flavobacterium sp. RHBU_3 TaxID=3391184 RepID=UPI003984EB82